jgi:hypothetical protein
MVAQSVGNRDAFGILDQFFTTCQVRVSRF